MDIKYLETNVYEESLKRIRTAINTHSDFYVSFSGGKDSSALVYLVLEVAKELNRLPVKVVFSDLEAIYMETERFALSIMDRDDVDPYWLCLPEIESNASSVYDRYFKFWEKGKNWCRDLPDRKYVITEDNIPDWLQPYYVTNNIEDWTIKYFGEALCDKNKTKDVINFIGLRADESYGRLMNIRSMKNRDKENPWTYRYIGDKFPRTWICLPIYDWEFEDIWHYHAINNLDYNRVYDSMHFLGVNKVDMRTCFAFGETQKNSLYQWCMIEPLTWDRMLKRVQGVNFGKMYNKTSLNSGKIKKPDNLTWKEYLKTLLDSSPEIARELFLDKFDQIFEYHEREFTVKLGIPMSIWAQDSKKDVKNKMEETGYPKKYFISYESLCGFIIKRDFVMSAYGFGMSEKMQRRILEITRLQGIQNDNKNI